MIKIEHLKKAYEDGFVVLKDISTEIKDGEVISIIGPSGTGKSTFLRCLNKLETASGGKIIINGTDITDPKTDISKVRLKVGMVFQNFNLFEHLSVLDNLMLGPIKLLGMPRREAEEQGRALLKQVGMIAKAEAFPKELSGGQKQRVAIARCLAMHPDVILFDEPTSALDPTMVSEVLSVIKDISKQGITMLIVTHEMKFAHDVSTRVFYMDQGGIYEDGTPQQIFDNPQKPLTQTFINRIRSFEYSVKDETVDYYDFFAKIETFCNRYCMRESTLNAIRHVTDEILNLCFNADGGARYAILRRDGSLDMTLSYSEKKDNAILEISAPQSFGPILAQSSEDDVELVIIKAYASDINECISEGRIKLTLSFEDR